MIDSVREFYAEAKKAGQIFDGFIQEYNLVGNVVADHICYKCSSSNIFESMRKVFENESNWIYQAIIAQRRIATIRTQNGLETLAGNINLVELSDQKPNGSQIDGFDHIEIYPSSMSYEDLVLILENKGLEVNKIVRPHHTTHDIKIEEGFIIRLTRESLAEIIKKEQM